MKTTITLALILASFVLVSKTNARPDRKISPSAEDLAEARSDIAEISDHNYASRPRSRHSRQTINSGPVWEIIRDKTKVSYDDEDDEGSRPISFKPSNQAILAGVHSPPVEHGSIEGDISQTTKKPTSTTAVPKTGLTKPTKCHAAIINCCRYNEPQRKSCFTQLNCSKTYETGKACLPEAIQMVINIFAEAFRPR